MFIPTLIISVLSLISFYLSCVVIWYLLQDDDYSDIDIDDD